MAFDSRAVRAGEVATLVAYGGGGLAAWWLVAIVPLGAWLTAGRLVGMCQLVLQPVRHRLALHVLVHALLTHCMHVLIYGMHTACTLHAHCMCMCTACTLEVRHWLALLPCALLSCGCALGGVGWVFGCGREGGVALQPTTLLLPLLLLPLLLDGAFGLLAATEAAWKAGQDDAQVRRLVGALERVSSPLSASLLASLAGCALAPLAGVYDADGAAAMAVSGPALQLAVGLAVGLLSVQAMLYTLFWGSILTELSHALRTVLRQTVPHEVRT